MNILNSFYFSQKQWFLITDSDFLGSHRMTCVYYIHQQVTTNPVALRTAVHLSLDV